MNKQTLGKILATLPFFEGMAPEYLEIFAGCAHMEQFEKNHHILLEGKPAEEFHIIRSGLVLIEADGGNRGPIPIQSLGVGDVLGWSWLIPPFVWHFDAKAVEDTHTIVVDARCIRDKIAKDIHLECELYKRFNTLMMRRLLATRLQLTDFYS